MPKQTQQERIVDALISQGYRRVVNARSSKYITLENTDPDRKLFIGKAGAIRMGKNATDSISVTDRMKAKLLGDPK